MQQYAKVQNMSRALPAAPASSRAAPTRYFVALMEEKVASPSICMTSFRSPTHARSSWVKLRDHGCEGCEYGKLRTTEGGGRGKLWIPLPARMTCWPHSMTTTLDSR